MVDVCFPRAPPMRGGLDNLNTHVAGALYEAFAPDAARRIWDRRAWPHTPPHGRGLTMAALEFSVLGRQGVDRRLPDHDTLVRAIAAGEAPRHSTQAPMLWRFSTADARIKLTPRYPIVQVHEDQHDVAPPDQPTSTAA